MERSTPTFVTVLALTAALYFASASPVAAIQVSCDFGGDQFGWAVAADGDLDGDGVDDIAISAPCSRANRQTESGRVSVYSGATGVRILEVKGEQIRQRLGGAIAFIDDLDGDGSDELIVGSTGWTDPVLDIEDAGKVSVHNLAGEVLFTVLGQYSGGRLGEAVTGLADVTGDGVADIIVGAGRAEPHGQRPGHAVLISGSNGAVVETDPGEEDFDGWGAVVGPAGDVNGDGVADIFIASGNVDAVRATRFSALTTTTTSTTITSSTVLDVTTSTETSTSSTTSTTMKPALGKNTGVVKVVSGLDLSDDIVVVSGLSDDRLGRAVVSVGDVDGDGAPDFLAGAPGADPANKNKAGIVMLFSATAEVLGEYSEPSPQLAAAFGTSIAVLGDIDEDGVVDFAASAPARGARGSANLGRVAALSSFGEEPDLWEIVGDVVGARLGQSLASSTDLDDDGMPDLIIGAPGDTAKGRRGAGSARVVSGVDGAEIRRFAGRRGRETRIFAAGWQVGARAQARSFGRNGRRKKLRADVFRGLRDGAVSIAVLDEPRGVEPGTMKIVLGSPTGSTVEVYSAARRRRLLSRFDAFGPAYTGGVNVAAGDLSGDGEDTIVVSQASAAGAVRVKAYSRLDIDPFGRINWAIEDWSVDGFATADRVGGVLVNAEGAYVAVGDLGDNDNDRDGLAEVVISPTGGAPCVRVLDGQGRKKAEWLAYSPSGNSGTVVAVGNLDGGADEIITVPAQGQPWVKAFDKDGNPYIPRGGTTPVSFFFASVAPLGTMSLAIADVDLDGDGEILLASEVDGATTVKAFEADGTPVADWKPFKPFGPLAAPVAIAGTDRFVRN